MRLNQKKQDGFHAVELIIVLLVLGVIGFAGWRVLNKDKSTDNDSSQQSNSSQSNNQTETAKFIQWQFNGNEWSALGAAPTCEEPLTLDSPLKDITKATAVLYPGEVRGGDFKPHGGLALDGAQTGQVDVTAMRDGYLFRGARYIEDGEIQYMVDFMDSCGVVFRFDHLFTLSADVMKEVDKLPAAAVDDSRTHNFSEPVFFKKGTVIATEVGHPKTKNFGFDIGAYDVRKPNAASQTSKYKTDQLRIADKELSFYALCWWDYLPDQEKSLVKALPTRGGKVGSSDYCEI